MKNRFSLPKKKLGVIGVAVGVLLAIVWWNQSKIGPPSAVTPPVNGFTLGIQDQINQIANLSIDALDFTIFDVVSYKINDAHEKNKFSNISADNDRWKQILDANLTAAFAPKHIDQVKHYFSKGQWKHADCQKIKTFEKETLLKSSSIVSGSPMHNDLQEIIATIDLFFAMEKYAMGSPSFGYSSKIVDDLKQELGINDNNKQVVSNHAYLKNNKGLIGDLDKKAERIREAFFNKLRKQYNEVKSGDSYEDSSQLNTILENSINTGLFDSNAIEQFRQWQYSFY